MSDESAVTDRAYGPKSDDSSLDGAHRISQADAFELFSNRRRRCVIHALKYAAADGRRRTDGGGVDPGRDPPIILAIYV